MKNYKFAPVLCLLVATMAVGCRKNSESDHHFDNKVFISATSFASEVRIEKQDDNLSREIRVGMALPENHDVKVVLRAAPELLETYREAYYDSDIQLLASSHYDLSQATATIVGQKVESSPVTFRFTNLSKLDLQSRYVLPITIESVDGVGLLESGRTIYYVFKEASLVNVVGDINENYAWPDWENFDQVADMQTFTLEALVNAYAFQHSNGQTISTIMGIEDLFLIRVGDATIPKNQLQVAYAKKVEDVTTRGNVTNSSLALQANRWYHIAVTFDHGRIKVYLDGRERASADASALITSVNFKVAHSDESDNKPRCFWVGYSYNPDRCLNGMIAEARVWNKALSADEINAEDHFYKIDPSSQGLVAYWKFNDNQGKTIKDFSPYGNNLSAARDLKWEAVELPVKEKK